MTSIFKLTCGITLFTVQTIAYGEFYRATILVAGLLVTGTDLVISR